MSRMILSLVGFAALVTLAMADDAKPGSKFGKDIRVPANSGFVAVVSEDKQAAELIFDNLFAEVSPAVRGARSAHNQTASQSKVFTVNIPYATDQRSVAMTMDLRGFVSADPGATVRLVACAGDATTVIDLSKAKSKTVKLKGESKLAFAGKQPSEQSGDFASRVEFTVQTHAANPVCQVTLFLLTEHDTDKADAGGALLVVDSLDLQFSKSTKAAYKP